MLLSDVERLAVGPVARLVRWFAGRRVDLAHALAVPERSQQPPELGILVLALQRESAGGTPRDDLAAAKHRLSFP